jgi:hypothetical protein
MNFLQTSSRTVPFGSVQKCESSSSVWFADFQKCPPLVPYLPDIKQHTASLLQSLVVNGRISNFGDLVDSESLRYFEGDSDSTWDSTNLLTNPNICFHQKSSL